MNRTITYTQALLEELDQSLSEDPNVYIMGLGVPDPKGIFGTTLGLQEKYGSSRVMDMPTSENGMTGMAIGSALMGMKPIITHQRVDFFLLAYDQLVNNAAKWHYMFNGQMNVPLVIRLIVGRGWGQGPQHSQNLHASFAHFPGLKVVMPTTAYDAKGLLRSSILDPNPVLFIEHRWLHSLVDYVPEESYEVPIGKAKVARVGKDLTIVASGHMTVEALKAAGELKKSQIEAEVIDLRTIKPLDIDTILNSVKKTGHLLVADESWKTLGLASEIITLVVEKGYNFLKKGPVRVTLPDCYAPTSWALTNHYYPGKEEIIGESLNLLKHPNMIGNFLERNKKIPLDIPDKSFTGPF
jgi:pyruvate/2-oxoglutarate/acetoin dehydrogenase E1 component